MKAIAILALCIAALSAAIGESFMAYGMRSMGNISWASPSHWLDLVLAVVKNVHVTVGVLFLAGFFFIYLATLSKVDLSFAMPLTSMSFIFGALIAWLFLGEQVSWHRWVGTIVIVIGIALIALDQNARTAPGNKSSPASTAQIEESGR